MFETVGTTLCQALRHFASVTCPRYATKELPREANARIARGNKTRKGASSAVKSKKFNMSTFKLHCIPDYPPTIRKYGTTDSYSTQIVSLFRRDTRLCFTTDYYRASWHIVYPKCGTGHQTRIVGLSTRSPTKRAAHGSTLRCARNQLRDRDHPPPRWGMTITKQEAASTKTLKTEMPCCPIQVHVIGCPSPVHLAKTSPNGS